MSTLTIRNIDDINNKVIEGYENVSVNLPKRSDNNVLENITFKNCGYVSLTYCHIKEIKNIKIENVDILNLSNNYLNKLHGDLGNLISLNITNNDIHEIALLPSSDELVNLHVCNNSISVINIDQYPNLKRLFASSQVMGIHTINIKDRHLTTLSLNDNYIPKDIICLDGCEIGTLNLNENLINGFSFLSGIKHLGVLLMADNGRLKSLETLPSDFFIEYINLNSCFINDPVIKLNSRSVCLGNNKLPENVTISNKCDVFELLELHNNSELSKLTIVGDNNPHTLYLYNTKVPHIHNEPSIKDDNYVDTTTKEFHIFDLGKYVVLDNTIFPRFGFKTMITKFFGEDNAIKIIKKL